MTIQEGIIYLILGNNEYEISNESSAKRVYKEIRRYW